MRRDKCKSCGKEVWWAQTVHGRMMMIEENPKGKIGIINGRAQVLKEGDMFADYPDKLYTSHFATCPHAAQHRRPR